MSRRITLRPEAVEEVAAAASWYGERAVRLDVAFLDEVAATLASILESPERHPPIEDEIRKAVLRRFPYIVLFRRRADEIVVIACFHTRRDPETWKRRL